MILKFTVVIENNLKLILINNTTQKVTITNTVAETLLNDNVGIGGDYIIVVEKSPHNAETLVKYTIYDKLGSFITPNGIGEISVANLVCNEDIIPHHILININSLATQTTSGNINIPLTNYYPIIRTHAVLNANKSISLYNNNDDTNYLSVMIDNIEHIVLYDENITYKIINDFIDCTPYTDNTPIHTISKINRANIKTTKCYNSTNNPVITATIAIFAGIQLSWLNDQTKLFAHSKYGTINGYSNNNTITIKSESNTSFKGEIVI